MIWWIFLTRFFIRTIQKLLSKNRKSKWAKFLLVMKRLSDLKTTKTWSLTLLPRFCIFQTSRKKFARSKTLWAFSVHLASSKMQSSTLFYYIFWFFLKRFLPTENGKNMCLVRYSTVEESVMALVSLHGIDISGR